MGRWAIFCAVVCFTLLAAAAGYFFLIPVGWGYKSSAGADQGSQPKDRAASTPAAGEPSQGEIYAMLAPPKEKLPETTPPLDLPIVAWGTRDFFPMIRKPKFLTAAQAASALADKEPVLGLAVGKDARAYSTNQLNKHELVLDEVGGIPVLVTY